MPRTIDPKKRRDQAKKAYLSGRFATYAEVAAHFGVTERTIDNWSRTESPTWREQKEILDKQKKLIDFQAQSEQLEQRRADREQRSASKKPREFNELATVEEVIESLVDSVPICQRDDLRALGSVASALLRFLEYRRSKLKPPTAVELAELALEFDITPEEFVAALKSKWQQSA